MDTLETKIFCEVMIEREDRATALLGQMSKGELHAMLSYIYEMEKLVNREMMRRRQAQSPNSLVADGDDIRGEGE